MLCPHIIEKLYVAGLYRIRDHQCLFYDLCYMDGLAHFLRVLAGKLGNLVNDFFRALRGVIYFLHVCIIFIVRLHARQDHGGIPHDGRQQVIELMRDTAGHGADQLQPLFTGQPFFLLP